MDDYELLFDDRSDAERALTALEDALAEFELELNPQKTEIVSLPQELENPGIQELRGFRGPCRLLSSGQVVLAFR